MGEYRLEISDDETNPFASKIINQAKSVSKEYGISLEESVELICKAMKSGNKFIEKCERLI